MPGHTHVLLLGPPGEHFHLPTLEAGGERQQYYAPMAENGVLDVDDRSQEDLARAIRSRL